MGRRWDYFEAGMAQRAGELSARPRRVLRNVVITLTAATTIGVAAALVATRENNHPTPLPDEKPPATTPDTTNKPSIRSEGLYPLTRPYKERA